MLDGGVLPDIGDSPALSQNRRYRPLISEVRPETRWRNLRFAWGENERKFCELCDCYSGAAAALDALDEWVE